MHTKIHRTPVLSASCDLRPMEVLALRHAQSACGLVDLRRAAGSGCHFGARVAPWLNCAVAALADDIEFQQRLPKRNSLESQR
jgi:hypothetical protein